MLPRTISGGQALLPHVVAVPDFPLENESINFFFAVLFWLVVSIPFFFSICVFCAVLALGSCTCGSADGPTRDNPVARCPRQNTAVEELGQKQAAGYHPFALHPN